MKLAFRRLDDYPYKPVWEVLNDGKVIGLLEKAYRSRTYKAFAGSGFNCRYLSLYYSKAAAVRAILKYETQK